MKKYATASMLVLQLTRKAVLTVFLTQAAVFFIWAERWLLRPEAYRAQSGYDFSMLLSSILIPGGLFGFALLAALLLSAGSSHRSKSIYTLHRLGLTKTELCSVFWFVFSGYFFLFWVLQILLYYALFALYSRHILASSLEFMATVIYCSHSCRWLHLVLPLGNLWNYLRNLILCISFGRCAAVGSLYLQRGIRPWGCIIPIGLSLFLINPELSDLFVTPLLIVGNLLFIIVTHHTYKEVTHEEDL